MWTGQTCCDPEPTTGIKAPRRALDRISSTPSVAPAPYTSGNRRTLYVSPLSRMISSACSFDSP